MRRCLLLIAATSFGLSLLLFSNRQEAQAQTRSNDLIRFMAAVQGNTFNPALGLEWCVSQGWHESYAAVDGYPAGPRDAVDEVSQWGTPGWTYANCHSQLAEPVQLSTNGTTDGGSNCTTSAPCPSLIVKGTGATYDNGCHYIEADLYDYTTYDVVSGTGDWKGKQRMLHATVSTSPWTAVIYVAWVTWFYDSVTVGNIIDETSPGCVITGLHVHQDFMLPTPFGNCAAGLNTSFIPPSPNTAMDLQKQNPDHYVHYLSHSFGNACVVPGPDAANWLLRSGGELDDTCAGIRALAQTGTPILSASTTFTQSGWSGRLTVHKELLVAAYLYSQGMRPIDYYRSQRKSVPPSGSPYHYFWYGPDSPGYYFQLWWLQDNFTPFAGTCFATGNPQKRYWADFKSSAGGSCNVSDQWLAITNPSVSSSYGFDVDNDGGLQTMWTQFRGAGGVNPSISRSDVQLQNLANQWALDPNNGCATVVKPSVDAVIRSSRNQGDLAVVGVGYEAGNSFDGQRW
jgi:hypothetical protein